MNTIVWLCGFLLLGIVFMVWSLQDQQRLRRQEQQQSLKMYLLLLSGVGLTAITSVSLIYTISKSLTWMFALLLLEGLLLLIVSQIQLRNVIVHKSHLSQRNQWLPFLGLSITSLSLTGFLLISETGSQFFVSKNVSFITAYLILDIVTMSILLCVYGVLALLWKLQVKKNDQRES